MGRCLAQTGGNSLVSLLSVFFLLVHPVGRYDHEEAGVQGGMAWLKGTQEGPALGPSTMGPPHAVHQQPTVIHYSSFPCS